MAGDQGICAASGCPWAPRVHHSCSCRRVHCMSTAGCCPCMCWQPADLSLSTIAAHGDCGSIMLELFHVPCSSGGRCGTHPLRCAGKRCDVSVRRIRICHAANAVRRCRTASYSRPASCLLCICSSAATTAAAVVTPANTPAAAPAPRAPARAQRVHRRPRQAVEVAQYHCGAAGRQPLRRRQQHARLGGLQGE
jgi:hypothetical protein